MAFPHYQQQSFQPCDGYLENYDRQLQLCPREHAKLVARERQFAIADAMSKAVSDEYQDDIVGHMLALDTATLPDVDSIDIQTEIKWFMRPYLLDFLVEAHSAFQLLPSTLFLTVNLLDRYCSKRVVYKRHYQLVGCAALLIAAKYGDKKERVPTIKELKSMCCSLYDEDMFVQMEWHVLQTLGWSVGHPTVDVFLQVAVANSAYDAEVEHLTLYILEIALFHRDFVSKLSADLARAALALSRIILGRDPAPPSDWAASYDTLTLIALSQNIPQPSQVLARKYSSSHYSRVSKVMDKFFQRQMAMAQPCNPPTPPADHVSSRPYQAEPGLATPQKQAYPSAHGYITPPITPDNDVFVPLDQQEASRENTHMSHQCRPSAAAAPVQYSQPQHCMVQEHGLYSQPQHYPIASTSTHPYNAGL